MKAAETWKHVHAHRRYFAPGLPVVVSTIRSRAAGPALNVGSHEAHTAVRPPSTASVAPVT